MPELKRLHAGDAPAVLAFEIANRAYFAAFVSDRGDEFFDQFADRYGALLAEQEADIGAFYVLVVSNTWPVACLTPPCTSWPAPRT